MAVLSLDSFLVSSGFYAFLLQKITLLLNHSSITVVLGAVCAGILLCVWLGFMDAVLLFLFPFHPNWWKDVWAQKTLTPRN